MSEPSHPSRGHRRKRRLSPDEKLLRDRLEAGHAENRPAEPAAISAPHPQSEPPAATRAANADLAVQPLIRGCFRFFKVITRTTALIYLLGLLAVAWATDHIGQANLTTAALMYLPPSLWLAPAFLLLLPCLLFDWKSLLAVLAGIVVFCFSYLDYQWRPESELGPPTPFESFRLLTWNRGQGKQASLSKLKDELKLDFILLQDAAGRAAGYQTEKNYGEFRGVAQAAEFVLLSRWPILSSEALATHTETGSVARGNPAAARFVVLAAGTRLTIYSVHLRSPRDTLESYKRGSFLWGVLGIPGTPWEAKKLRYQAFWDEQIAAAAQILERIQTETGPVLVMGDFNTPAMGPIYKMYAEGLQDAHRSAGSGLGYTFPGDTNNPLALFQPWLRLDQIFASSHWQIVRCTPQNVTAQHLPVFSELKLVQPPTL